MSNIEVYDVVIVGGGGSGLAAAVSAAECGARVLLLEKNPHLGGTTGIAVGSFTAAGTRWQRENGIDDSIDAHCIDAGQFAPADIEARNNASLRREFLGQAAETLEWLSSMGLHFHGPSPEPPNRVPRMHNVVPNAKAYVAALQARLLQLGGEIRCHARVTDLLTDAGRVSGVQAVINGTEHAMLAAKGVVLATGDYANSPQLIAESKGGRFAAIEGINSFATGEGHLLAREAGGKLVNMDVTYGPEIRFEPPPGRSFHQLLPTQGPAARWMGRVLPWVPGFLTRAMIKRLLVTWQHPEAAIFNDGAILINNRGERFCDETRWPDREISIAEQPEKRGYILLDERLINRYGRWPHFISTAPEIAYAYVADYLRLRPDVATRARSLDELARKRGISATELRQSVAHFNCIVRQEAADPFGRPRGEFELAGENWVLLGPARAYFTTTEGGAAINRQFQVLDQGDRPIPGLYAVGQIGLGGQILWGHGLHIAWALTSGRLLGRQLGESVRPVDGA